MRIPKEHRQAYHDAKLDYLATGQTDNDYLDLVLHNSSDTHVGRSNNKLLDRMTELSTKRFEDRAGNVCSIRWNLSMLFRFERMVNGFLRSEGAPGRFVCVNNIDKHTTWSFRIGLKNGPLYVCSVNLEFEGKPRFMISDGVGLFIGNHQVVKIAHRPMASLLDTIPHIGPKLDKEYYLKYLNLRKTMLEGIYDTSFFQRTIEAVSARPDHDWQDH